MSPFIRRPINDRELAVLQATIERAPRCADPALYLSGLRELMVTGRCDCGCDSVSFDTQKPVPCAAPIADGLGTMESGEDVGIIVFGANGVVTELEVYGLADITAKLPVPESIRSYENSADYS